MTSATVANSWPPTDVVQQRISEAVSNGMGSDVRIIDRTRNPYSTTFPTEVVTCEFGNSSVVRLFCKHFYAEAGHSHRASIRPFYEIDVYRHLLSHAPLSLPRYIGSWTDYESGAGLLVLDYLHPTSRVHKANDHRAAMARAATWLGQFHGYASGVTGREDLSFIPRLDLQSYSDRCAHIIDCVGADNAAWLVVLYDRLERVLDIVRKAPTTIIHGEFYPQNILVHNDLICPVDWETAHVAMGELDLAMLVEGDWSQEVVHRCVAAYISACGQATDQSEVWRRFTAAQILMDLYWLSLYPEPEVNDSVPEKAPWRLAHAREAALRLGVL